MHVLHGGDFSSGCGNDVPGPISCPALLCVFQVSQHGFYDVIQGDFLAGGFNDRILQHLFPELTLPLGKSFPSGLCFRSPLQLFLECFFIHNLSVPGYIFLHQLSELFTAFDFCLLTFTPADFESWLIVLLGSSHFIQHDFFQMVIVLFPCASFSRWDFHFIQLVLFTQAIKGLSNARIDGKFTICTKSGCLSLNLWRFPYGFEIQILSSVRFQEAFYPFFSFSRRCISNPGWGIQVPIIHDRPRNFLLQRQNGLAYIVCQLLFLWSPDHTWKYPGPCISCIYRRFLRVHHVLWHKQGDVAKVTEIRFLFGDSNRGNGQTA